MGRVFFNRRGQVGIEFILLVGAILIMVLTVIPMGIKANELNKGIAAARDGATYGSTMRGMGFLGSKDTYPEGVILFDHIEYTITEVDGGPDNVSITIYVRIPSYFSNDAKTSVRGSVNYYAQSFLGRAFSGDYNNSRSSRKANYYWFNETSTVFISY